MATVNSVETVFTDLYSTPGTTTNETVEVLGYYAPGDGGGGTFYWDGSSTASSNGGTVIDPSGGISPGRWIRIFDSTINVRWFGAKGDGVTDDTAAVHAARDVAQRGNDYQSGTIYFPQSIDSNGDPQPYVGAFVFENRTNIVGDGLSSILASNGTFYPAADQDDPNPPPHAGQRKPILTLGVIKTLKGMRSRVSNINIIGDSKSCDGVYFYDTKPVADFINYSLIPPARVNNVDVFGDGILDIAPEYAGHWSFSNVMIQQCNRAVHKPMGNYGNTFTECWFQDNNYGLYALGYLSMFGLEGGMQAGCDRFVSCNFNYSTIAALYVNATMLYGQLVLQGCNIEANPGFGIVVKLDAFGQMTFGSVEVHNCWMESNGSNYPGNSTSVTLDGITYTVSDIMDYHFEGVRSVSLYDCYVYNMRLKNSSLAMYNCRCDNENWVRKYDIDSSSVVNAFELRNMTTVNESIFVHSLSYDGSSDIHGINQNPPNYAIPTSVWGPLRVVTQTGNNNILISQQYSGDSVTFDNVYNINATPADIFIVNGGILNARCTRISLPTGYSSGLYADNTNVAIFDDDTAQYYVWSIHSYCCGDVPQNVIGSIGTLPTATTTNIQLGNVILKPDQWVCSYGVKKLTGDSVNPPIVTLSFDLVTGANILFCDFQVVKFDNFYDAQSFLNSRAFAEGVSPCEIIEG